MLSADLGGGGERLATGSRAEGLQARSAPAGWPPAASSSFSTLGCVPSPGRAAGASPGTSSADSAGEPRPSSGSQDWGGWLVPARGTGDSPAPAGLGDHPAVERQAQRTDRAVKSALSFPEQHRALQRAGSSRTTLLNLNREEQDCFQCSVWPEKANGET